LLSICHKDNSTDGAQRASHNRRIIATALDTGQCGYSSTLQKNATALWPDPLANSTKSKIVCVVGYTVAPQIRSRRCLARLLARRINGQSR